MCPLQPCAQNIIRIFWKSCRCCFVAFMNDVHSAPDAVWCSMYLQAPTAGGTGAPRSRPASCRVLKPQALRAASMALTAGCTGRSRGSCWLLRLQLRAAPTVSDKCRRVWPCAVHLGTTAAAPAAACRLELGTVSSSKHLQSN